VAAGVASVRRCQKLSTCPIKTVPASSKRDRLLTKAEPISDVSSISAIRYFRKDKNSCKTAAGRESEKM